MNEVLFAAHRRWPRKAFFKRLLWSTARSCALGGLHAWDVEGEWLRVERHPMPIEGLGKGFEGATLVHLSDLHCCPVVRERYLRRCVEVVNETAPDFVVITGDFITGPAQYARRAARVLADLTPSVATLACLGNHDYGIVHPRGLGESRGLADRVAEYLMRADVFVMMNERRVFARGDSVLQFVGLEDYWSARYDPALAFAMAEPDAPTIALCHNPDASEELSAYGPDWILSGHTHGACLEDSLFRDLLLPLNSRHFTAGHYRLSNAARLYVNRGLGYSRRVNINARPEMTVFTLRAASRDSEGG